MKMKLHMPRGSVTRAERETIAAYWRGLFAKRPPDDLAKLRTGYEAWRARRAKAEPALANVDDIETVLCEQYWTWLYTERLSRGTEPSEAEKTAHPTLRALRRHRGQPEAL